MLTLQCRGWIGEVTQKALTRPVPKAELRQYAVDTCAMGRTHILVGMFALMYHVCMYVSCMYI